MNTILRGAKREDILLFARSAALMMKKERGSIVEIEYEDGSIFTGRVTEAGNIIINKVLR